MHYTMRRPHAPRKTPAALPRCAVLPDYEIAVKIDEQPTIKRGDRGEPHKSADIKTSEKKLNYAA